MEVDELDAALDDIGAGGAEGVVHMGQQFGVDLVLGVEDPDDLAGAVRQRGVERLGFVLRLVGVDDDPDPVRVTGRGPLGDLGGLRVVVSDDDDDLEVGVAGLEQPLDRVLQHRLLMAGGQEQGERSLAAPVGRCELGRGQRLRCTPGMHLPPERERGHPEKRQ